LSNLKDQTSNVLFHLNILLNYNILNKSSILTIFIKYNCIVWDLINGILNFYRLRDGWKSQLLQSICRSFLKLICSHTSLIWLVFHLWISKALHLLLFLLNSPTWVLICLLHMSMATTQSQKYKTIHYSVLIPHRQLRQIISAILLIKLGKRSKFLKLSLETYMHRRHQLIIILMMSL